MQYHEYVYVLHKRSSKETKLKNLLH